MTIWLNCEDNSRTYTKKNYLLDAAKRLGMVKVIGRPDPDILVRDLKTRVDEPIEYVLNIEPFVKFVSGGSFTGIWEIDMVLDRHELSPSNWIYSDTVFVANNTFPSRMLAHKHLAEVLFQACDPIIHRVKLDIKPEFDFVFSGSTGQDFYDKREAYLKKIKELFSFADFGKNHRPQKYVEYLNKARIQFVQSGTNKNAPTGYLAQRFFECLAIGPVLTNYHPDLYELGLEEDVDYMCFRTMEEMVKKANILLADDDLRERIRVSGRKKALLLHTYSHRLISIINKIREHDASRPAK